MLFVFQVDTGRMMTFDMGLALESVENLKSHVMEAFHIPVDMQVLLISGGEYLDSTKSVCSYHTGTDTNPIFLFSKAAIGAEHPPVASVELGSNSDLSSKVSETAQLPVGFVAVQRRSQLAQLIYDKGQEQLMICEKLAHEQHLQQQGWSAVVANLEDLTQDLQHRWDLYKNAFSEYLAQRESYINYLQHFKDDLCLLQKIPVLPALIESQKLLVVPEMEEELEQSESKSLLDWISQGDGFMEHFFEMCSKGVEMNNEEFFINIETELDHLLQLTNHVGMKEVKGLGDRLFGLEKLMVEARKYVNEQKDLSNAFIKYLQGAARTSIPRDSSGLPELCASHIQQIQALYDYHLKLRDITRRCVHAKNELSSNLYVRLKWVVYTEGTLSELDNKLVFNFNNLLQLQRNLEILQQVHTAPCTYFSAVGEVVRRRRFSQSFLLWANDIACKLFTIYNEELVRRKDFQATFENHFLSSLFPGMDDMPSAFATQAPSIFDSSLPNICEEDMEVLRKELPELADNFQTIDTSTMLNLFVVRDSKDDADKVAEDKVIEEVVSEIGLKIEGTTTHLKDLDKGCESETDTEEFEKVGQSPFELTFEKGASPRPGTQDASTLTEDDLQISRSEYEKVRSLLLESFQYIQQTNVHLRGELLDIKNRLLSEKADLLQSCEILNVNINNIIVEKSDVEREVMQRMNIDHELEISDFRKIGQSKNEEIKCLRDDNAALSANLKKVEENNAEIMTQFENFKQEIENYKQQIDAGKLEKEKCVKEAIDNLKCEHRSEMENIRARFKLMTTEKSPSENSLEKIERGDSSSITNTEILLIQMRENFESEKEVAISDAINRERQRWQKVMEDTMRDLDVRLCTEKAQLCEDIERRVCRDKDKQIELLREQMRNLSLECVKYKGTIAQLTDDREESDNSSEWLRRIQVLEGEKIALEEEVAAFKSNRIMSESVTVYEGKGSTDVATSPIKAKKRTEPTNKSGKLSVESCRPGDLVLVLWDSTYQNYRILQESNHFYFLNADCMELLGLQMVDGEPNKLYAYAEVEKKEYCHARKSTNRFKVPKGTKFFRVKVKEATMSVKDLGISQMSQSQTVSSTFTEESEMVPSKSLPSSPTKSEAMSWERSEVAPNSASIIPEEKGEDSSEPENVVVVTNEEIEKGTELTETFNVEGETQSIDR